MLPRRARLARGRLNCPLTGGIGGSSGSGPRAPEPRSAARARAGEAGAGLEVGGAGVRLPGAHGVRLARPSRPCQEGSALLSPTTQRLAAARLKEPGSKQLSTPHHKTMAKAGAPCTRPQLEQAWFAFYSGGLEVRPSGLWRLVEVPCGASHIQPSEMHLEDQRAQAWVKPGALESCWAYCHG